MKLLFGQQESVSAMMYREQLEIILSEMKKKYGSLSDEIGALPDSSLHILKRGDKEYYSERFPKKGNRKKERRYGISNDYGKIRALVRKKYIENALKSLATDIKLLSDVTGKYRSIDEASVMKKFVADHPDLADYIYKDAGDLDEWAANYERQEDFYEEGKTSVAGDRTAMRSRGEIVIAEKLRQYGIPFRYEATTGIPDLPYVPDFTVKRPRDGKLFYWEHFGDVNDEKYMKRNGRKLERYEEYGIVPWDNLIITYDFQDGGVNVPLIDGMIHAWLI